MCWRTGLRRRLRGRLGRGETDESMPKLSEFYGIQIAMWPNDHGVPHFHARYEGNVVSIAIATLAVLEGGIRPRALVMVRDWASAHRAELLTAWNTIRAGAVPEKIEPLD